MRKEFQLVTMPHMPPMMMTFAMVAEERALAMASAVTRPVPLSAARISLPVRTRPTAMMTRA